LLSGSLACTEAREAGVVAAVAPAELAAKVELPKEPAPGPAPVQARRVWSPKESAALQFLPPWRPEWRDEYRIDDSLRLAALEAGVLLYRMQSAPYERVPHTLVGGKLVPVRGLGTVAADLHDRRWREFYGRWPDALWRIVGATEPGKPASVDRWDGATWRPSSAFSDKCSLDHIGHSASGGLLVTTDGCTGEEGPPFQVYELGAAAPVRLGPALPRSPALGLATPEALVLAIDLESLVPDADPETTLQRYACAPPHDCAPEQVSLGGYLEVERWLDWAWSRRAGGLAGRGGVRLVHQRGVRVTEDYLLAHDGQEWRAAPSPGRITSLVAAPTATLVVTLAPVNEAQLDNPGWPDTLWVQHARETRWRPVELPQEVSDLESIQVAVDDEKLWLAVHFQAGRTRLFSALLAEIPSPSAPE
jgi:hypothetical protein